jgi:DNA phosphorothioation-associated putative methyltransferase
LEIARHRTALKRYDLSRPLRSVLAAGLLSKDETILDYGCGRGGDVRYLSGQGFRCHGWDPVFAPTASCQPADVVNIGYVVNVIENSVERADTLRRAWALARRLLIVSARLKNEAPDHTVGSAYEDGVITARGTFQKFFDQSELRIWIDKTLRVECVAASPGIFYVFCNPAERAAFQAARFRRASRLPPLHRRSELFDAHREVLLRLANFIAERGRPPAEDEWPYFPELRTRIGSIRRALQIIEHVSDTAHWATVRDARSEDLLLYLALSRFDHRPQFGQLDLSMQRDVKVFFGSYQAACGKADQALLALGDMEARSAALSGAAVGKLLPNALYLHVDALASMTLSIRLYEGCARTYAGSVEGANIVKLSRHEPKISYLSYPDFDEHAHPALATSLSVRLQTFQFRERDYRNSQNPPVLHRKECFLPADYPDRDRFARLTASEDRHGLLENPTAIGTRERWERRLLDRGFNIRGHRLLRNKRRLIEHTRDGTGLML